MEKSFKLTCKQDVYDLMRTPEYWDSLWGAYDFATYRNGTTNLPILQDDTVHDDDGEFRITCRATLNKSMLRTDTDAYAGFSKNALDTMVDSNKALLETHYQELLDKAQEVQGELLYLMMLMRLRERFNIQPVKHTDNQWIQTGGFGDTEYAFERSNMVYRMTYRIYKERDWNPKTRKSELTGVCQLTWRVVVQNPALGTPVNTIGEQEKKFKSEEEMQKYLDGRIKAYNRYFKEISPAIPEEFLANFTYAGQLLPGYHVEGH